MEDDWDLHAVVRSCCSSTTTATTAVSSFAATGSQNFSSFEQDCSFTWSQHPFEARRNRFAVEDLHELWKPFFPKQQILPISPLSVLQDLSSDQLQQQQQEIKQFTPPKQPLFSIVSGSKPSTTSHHPTPRSKKRKHHSKKVCHVAAESLSSDMWSWRKYGQKPIKGSPYPRGYYRCSTSKGCMARKQVERNRSDPGMFIITYTGDHNHPVPTHRNSLAGSTRQKPSSDDPKKPKLSPAPEKMESSREDFAEVEEEDEDDDDDDLSGMKVIADDDFFAGLEDFAGDCLPENSEFPWLAAGATTTRRPAAVE